MISILLSTSYDVTITLHCTSHWLPCYYSNVIQTMMKETNHSYPILCHASTDWLHNTITMEHKQLNEHMPSHISGSMISHVGSECLDDMLSFLLAQTSDMTGKKFSYLSKANYFLVTDINTFSSFLSPIHRLFNNRHNGLENLPCCLLDFLCVYKHSSTGRRPFHNNQHNRFRASLTRRHALKSH